MNDDRDTFDNTLAKLTDLWIALGKFTDRSSAVPYELTHMHAVAKALIDLCPLQPGDIAELIEPPTITDDENWGYRGAKHLFVIGRRVEVVHVRWSVEHRCYSVGFLFEHETWIDPITHEECVVSDRALYTLGARRFRKTE